MRDDHRHCPCNLVTLCRTCHAWAHANPDEAGAQGYIVSQWSESPGFVRVKAWWGWVEMDCVGESEWKATA